MTNEYSVRKKSTDTWVVTTRETGGIKNRGSRLLHALKARYVNRDRGYVVTTLKLSTFEKKFKEGWDAEFFSDKLIPPSKPASSVAKIEFTRAQESMASALKTGDKESITAADEALKASLKKLMKW